MKILLVGEYSRLHNSLKEGLAALGHQVKIVGFKDGFKDYPVDFPIEKKWDSGILKKIKLVILYTFGFDISSYLTYRQFWKRRNEFRNYDIVQLINENCFFCNYKFEKKILDFIFSNNKKVFLLSSGDDYPYVIYNFEHPENPSIVQPYLAGKIADKDFSNVLKYRTKPFEKLHHYVYENIRGVIASDFDYHIALLGHPKYLGLIPSPVNLDKLPLALAAVTDKVIIFHGINRESYFKKGNDFYEQALKTVAEKYGNKVEILTAENVPYAQFINSYNQAHIVIDQLYGHDKGTHGLESMAKGKLVFTNASDEFMRHYQLTEKVAVNGLPDVGYLVEQLSYFIENPDEIEVIGRHARSFIEREHHYLKVAERYLEVWEKNNGALKE